MLMSDFETFGFLFESMCIRNILVYAQATHANVYCYRDQSGLEADAILETEDGRWAAMEIKLGHHQTDTAASNLIRLRGRPVEAGARPPAFLAVVEGVGNYAHRRQDGVCVVPICCLGPWRWACCPRSKGVPYCLQRQWSGAEHVSMQTTAGELMMRARFAGTFRNGQRGIPHWDEAPLTWATASSDRHTPHNQYPQAACLARKNMYLDRS